jgi:hypothetical protein
MHKKSDSISQKNRLEELREAVGVRSSELLNYKKEKEATFLI